MRIIYKRNTHDENGEYRKPEYFGMIDINKRRSDLFKNNGIIATQDDVDSWSKHNKSIEEQELFFGVHTFTKNEMDFEQIYKATFDLLHGGALCGTYDPKDPRLTIEGHLKALAFMIEYKLVKAEIRVA